MGAELLGLRPGLVFAGAQLMDVAAVGAAAHLALRLPSGEALTFVLDLTGPVGPFPQCPTLTYRSTPLPFSVVEPIGHALAQAIAAAASGALPAQLRAWQGEASSLEANLDALVDRPGRSLRVAEFSSADLIAARPCVVPWTRLELGFAQQVGPCCADFQVQPQTATGPPLDLWQSAPLRGFRRALASPGHPATCRRSCPRLAGRSDALDSLVLRGGTRAFVDNQRLALSAIIAGDERPRNTPLELVVSTTSHCNYDCLMCHFGQEGSLSDELPASFYASLEPLWPGLARFEALGGEPLASPVFRDFLAGPTLRQYPDVRVALTTNGSYLTAAELDRLAGVSFEHLTISLNAATPDTYRDVNRGLPWLRIRHNLDALLDRKRNRHNPESVSYSMVILRRNHGEIAAFAELAEKDGVGVRFMLPMNDRGGQSFLTDAGLMREVEAQLREVARRLHARGQIGDARRASGEAEVLRDRLARGVLRPLPDDVVQLRRG